MELRRWVAVDVDGHVVQTMEIEWPDGHPDPDGAMGETRAAVEAKGFTFVLIPARDPLPEVGSTWDGSIFTPPQPAPPTPDEQATETVKDTAAFRTKLRDVATGTDVFSAAERDRVNAFIALQFLE